MTRRQALAIARKKWGKKGAVSEVKDEKRIGSIITLPGIGQMFHVLGSGATWEAAVTDALRRADRPLTV